MAKKPFSIAEYIQPEDVSNLDRPADVTTVVLLPIGEIAENELNFYDTSNVDELVNSVALNGLLEPISVMPQPEADGKKYRIISGHRRFKAFSQLAEDDPEKYKAISAIVREPPKNEIVEELLLIEGNRATRVLSSADTLKQAERYKELLVSLKEQGVEIPGRLRDVVAEAMQISASRLARLEVIRKGLIPEWMEKFDAGKLNESAAYELARSSQRAQQLLLSKRADTLTSDNISSLTGYIEDCFAEHDCKATAQKCDHGEDFWLAGKGKDSSWSRCVPNHYSSTGKCCADCEQADKCKFVCEKALPELQRRKDESRKKSEAATAARELEQKRKEHEMTRSWTRIVSLCEGNGVTIPQIARVSEHSADEIEGYLNGIFPTYAYYANPRCLSLETLRKLSKLSGCSINKLMGYKGADDLDDDPEQPAESAQAAAPGQESALRWRDVQRNPPQDGTEILALCGEREAGFAVWCENINLLLYRDGRFWHPELPELEYPHTRVIGWIPSPLWEEPADVDK